MKSVDGKPKLYFFCYSADNKARYIFLYCSSTNILAIQNAIKTKKTTLFSDYGQVVLQTESPPDELLMEQLRYEYGEIVQL